MCIEIGVVYDSVVEVSKETGIHDIAITNCCLWRSKTSDKMNICWISYKGVFQTPL